MAGKSKLKQAETLGEAAEAAYFEGDLETCESKAQAALALAGEVGAGADQVRAGMMNLLAGVFRRQERTEEALQLTLDLLPIMERDSADDDGDLGGVLTNAAQMLAELERHTEAIPYFKRALALKQNAMSTAREEEAEDAVGALMNNEAGMWANSLAMSYHGLLGCYHALGMRAEANALITEAVPFISKHASLDLDREFTELLMQMDENEAACELCTASIATAEQALRAPRNKFAVLNPSAMQFELAKEEFAKQKTVPGEVLLLMVRRLRLEHLLGRGDGDASALPQLNNVTMKIYGEDSMQYATHHREIGVELHFLAQQTHEPAAFQQAEAHYRALHAIFTKALPPGDRFREELSANLHELFSDQNKPFPPDLADEV